MPYSLPRHVSLPAILEISSAALLLAYIYALVHRPEYPDRYTVNDREYTEYDRELCMCHFAGLGLTVSMEVRVTTMVREDREPL
jgi:hypothetical protein